MRLRRAIQGALAACVIAATVVLCVVGHYRNERAPVTQGQSPVITEERPPLPEEAGLGEGLAQETLSRAGGAASGNPAIIEAPPVPEPVGDAPDDLDADPTS